MVVIAIVASFTALLLPALSKAKQQTQASQCLNNLRQLTHAWFMYSGDNRNMLVPNGNQYVQTASITNPIYQSGQAWAQWCPGLMNTDEATNPAWIELGLLYPFVNTVSVYHCPSDTSQWPPGGPAPQPQLRSYAMNGWLNPINPWVYGPAGAGISNLVHIYTKDADFGVPGPGNLYLFLDENPLRINDAFFVNDPKDPDDWVDSPSTYHNNASAITFCDGHAQLKKWTDPIRLHKDGDKTTVEIAGLDIYDPIKDVVNSRDVHDIAYWMVDDDYDGSNFVVRQVFFCGGDKDEFDEWKRGLSDIAKAATKKKAEQTLKVEIDDEAFTRIYGHTSHPFPVKKGQKIAVRVISQFGEETTKVLEV